MAVSLFGAVVMTGLQPWLQEQFALNGVIMAMGIGFMAWFLGIAALLRRHGGLRPWRSLAAPWVLIAAVVALFHALAPFGVPVAFFSSLLVLPLLLVAAGVALAQPSEWYFEPPFAPHRARIGVQVQPMTPELREHFGAPPDRGLLVTRIVDGGPAARGGVEVGDVIVSAAGTLMHQPFDLVKVVGRAAPGQAVELRILRDGEERKLSVEPEGEAMPWVDPKHWSEWLSKGMRQGAGEPRRHDPDPAVEQPLFPEAGCHSILRRFYGHLAHGGSVAPSPEPAEWGALDGRRVDWRDDPGPRDQRSGL